MAEDAPLGPPPPDLPEATRALWEAAQGGDAAALCDLAFLIAKGEGGFAQNEQEAARFYQRAADLGNARGLMNLAGMYEQGRGGLARDRSEAIRLYRLAADQGAAFAIRALERLTSQ